ncbi:uncharacterized protein magl isoform X2 [Centropristis striata]|uniref:uncharacterized protein magl isoform X2 n=1 Tax=Centropristis striata TaxID=184440 RepID=UPI0027DFA144|nr:uncharacterized protein magl isoform X2 [Centropristis striata]
MPATDSEFTSMEDSHTLEDEEGSSANVPSSVPAPTVPPTPLDPTTTGPNFPNETMMEKKAVSMASNDCSSALSSPAEASPAKPAATSPTTLEGSFETSPATSRIASASDSLKSTGTSLVDISESPLSLPSITFGSSDPGQDFPAVLTFKGVSVTLENNSVWKKFNSCGTEMILTKQGRRMFPYCRYRLAGLDPERQYSLVLSIVPSDQYRYRWSSSKWEVSALAEHQGQGLIRAFPHHYSPCKGSDWMSFLVSFYKLKLTNYSQDQAGHMVLHSMHRYIPRLHVIPVPDGDVATPDQPVVMGPECMTFTFPQTEFMAVTTYQNFRITQLKINHNPFAKGFREDGNNPRLQRLTPVAQPVETTDTQPSVLQPAELEENAEEVVDLSTKNLTVPAPPSKEQETRVVLKPIMSSSKDEPYVPCIRGKHALGELVLVQKPAPVEPNEETHDVSKTPEVRRGFTIKPKTPTFSKSTPGSSPGYRKKKRRRINKHWANSRGRQWKAEAASPLEVHCPSLTVAMQPELDDVEGLLFVSFTSKEALDVHVRDNPATKTASASPVSLTTPMQFDIKVEVIQETDDEKIARLEALLLQDLRLLKHRQVIHPVLQEVGLKLSSLELTKSIDMQYLGVHLPIPPPNLPEHDTATALSPGDEGFSFISRTGKTSDITKIKGWKNKFLRSKETSHSNSDGSQKNLSAFCSNMLDEYLESEAQNISERAAAFSTNSEGSVAYQLPVKSSSYVKTLDSALKHRKAASKSPVRSNRPCPLSHKPLLYSALTSPAPPLASPEVPVQAGAESIQQSASSNTQSGAHRFNHSGSQRPAVSCGQSQVTHRSGFTKVQLKLLQMEFGALSQGLSRTQLTPDRLSVALSVMLTKQMLPSQVFKTCKNPRHEAEIPDCGQEFCTLGCVCSSLEHLNRGPLHCRRPDCMFGCTCFKRKITKQLSAGESELPIQPVYSMSTMEHMVQPGPGSHAKKLWNHNIDDEDPEPVFTPKSSPPCLAPVKSVKRSSVTRPTYPIREEDKDPVYKYLESMMTCARVREFNSKPPPELTIEPKILDPSTLNTTEKTQKTTTDNQPNNYDRTTLSVEGAEKASQKITPDEMNAKKQIEIQSACQWDKDSNTVLEALCRRMKQNKLSQPFWVGPYSIRPITKIFMRKPSGSVLTYRIHISKPSKASDNDEDEYDDSDEEKPANESFDGDLDAEEDDGLNEESEMRYGVTPFLSGVLPAGRLRASTKPVGCQASGLIQVNGKSYNHARLLLGNMGSLHPANRLAAFVTGRLHPPCGTSLKNSEKSDPINKTTTPGNLCIKASGTVVPPIITARKTTDLKAPTQPPVPLFQSDSWKKTCFNLLSQTSSTINPFVSGQLSSVSPFQKSSTSSPVSLTVSQSLKAPSFLGQSGTYSFRICPPANQGTTGQKLPGVTLPGGFTLIQLPKPGADGAASESVNSTNTAGADKTPPQKDALINFGQLAAAQSGPRLFGSDAFTRLKDLFSSRPVEPGPSSELTCEKKMPSDENDETNNRHSESNFDIGSEDLSSDSSDYCVDEDDGLVDIETVEEARQGIAISKMKECISMAQQESRDLSARELNIKEEVVNDEDCKDRRRRENHTVLERQRRSEQRHLFDKLQAVLQSDPRAPRSTLLSQALKEIRNLTETSKYLEEKKRRLIRLQSIYVKELSLLSGKTDTMIKTKLNEICKKQEMREKMKWKPFFSSLLQSRAAFLQANAPQSRFWSGSHMTPPQDNPIKSAAERKILSLIQAHLQSPPAQTSPQTPTPQSVSSPAQVKVQVTAPSLQGIQLQTKPEGQPKIPDVPAQASMPSPQTEGPVAATPQVTAAQDEASLVSSAPSSSSNPPALPAKSFSLPLIRSKTGRIILPSSLKPIGQGFYTLVVMEAKQKEKEDQINKQTSGVGSFKNQDKSVSDRDHPSDSESSSTLKDKSVKSLNSNSERSGVTAPLAGLALLNKSIFVPPVVVRTVESSQVGGTAVGVKKTPSTARLSFTHMKQTPKSVEPNLNPVVGQRRRGRPPKNPITPVSAAAGLKVVEYNKSVIERKTLIQIKEKQSEKRTFEETKTQAEDCAGTVSDNPVPVKRGRGRPPRSKSAQLGNPAVRAGKDSPFRLPYRDIKPKESPDTFQGETSTSRPLTRGSLGKDFPSAKKRSWIDLEKELEPELESE